MWPETSNPKVEPPVVRKMPGRPRKNRKNELGEVPSSGKLPKRGKTMSCSACKSKNHNIRTCPNKPPITSEVHLISINVWVCFLPFISYL